jgi:hypothetical protein
MVFVVDRSAAGHEVVEVSTPFISLLSTSAAWLPASGSRLEVETLLLRIQQAVPSSTQTMPKQPSPLPQKREQCSMQPCIVLVIKDWPNPFCVNASAYC